MNLSTRLVELNFKLYHKMNKKLVKKAIDERLAHPEENDQILAEIGMTDSEMKPSEIEHEKCSKKTSAFRARVNQRAQQLKTAAEKLTGEIAEQNRLKYNMMPGSVVKIHNGFAIYIGDEKYATLTRVCASNYEPLILTITDNNQIEAVVLQKELLDVALARERLNQASVYFRDHANGNGCSPNDVCVDEVQNMFYSYGIPTKLTWFKISLIPALLGTLNVLFNADNVAWHEQSNQLDNLHYAQAAFVVAAVIATANAAMEQRSVEVDVTMNGCRCTELAQRGWSFRKSCTVDTNCMARGWDYI
jgi:hypothetical protein